MDDLARWLGAQLDEDERTARAVQQPGDAPWEARHMAGEETEGAIRWDVPGVAQPTHVDPLNKARMEHIAAHDPARVLREIDAKRRTIALCEPPLVEVTGPGDMERQFVPCEGPPWGIDVLKLLALPYADRPGYRDEWRP